MEARQEDELPRGPGWQYEPKWDGFRCIALRDGDQVELLGRSGKSLSRYFPEMVEALRSLKPRRFILDGELTVPVGRILSFEELQMRLHPAASRVAKLAAANPSLLIVFDMLQTPRGADLTAKPLRRRRAALEKFMAAVGRSAFLRLSPTTTAACRRRQVAEARGQRPPRRRRRPSASTIPISPRQARHGEGEEPAHRRLRRRRLPLRRIGKDGSGIAAAWRLFNAEGKLDHVGFVSGFPDADRAALTKKVKALIGKPGFTGDKPGGPSRWSTERSAQWQPLRTRAWSPRCNTTM